MDMLGESDPFVKVILIIKIIYRTLFILNNFNSKHCCFGWGGNLNDDNPDNRQQELIILHNDDYIKNHANHAKVLISPLSKNCSYNDFNQGVYFAT